MATLCALVVVWLAGGRWGLRGALVLFALALLWVLTYRNSFGMIFHTENLTVAHVLVLGASRAAAFVALVPALATLIDGLSPAQRGRAAGRLRDMAAEFRVLHARAAGPGAAADLASNRLP